MLSESEEEDELATSTPSIIVGTNPSVVITKKRTIEQRSPQKEPQPQRSPLLSSESGLGFGFRFDNPATATSTTTTTTPIASTAKEAITMARNMVLQAATLADTNEEQGRLLDLLEIFRDYTETGRVQTHKQTTTNKANTNTNKTYAETLGKTAAKATTPTTTTTTTPTPTLPLSRKNIQ
jgi:hypothetical protein